MTPPESAQRAWERDPRQMTEEAAAVLAPLLWPEDYEGEAGAA